MKDKHINKSRLKKKILVIEDDSDIRRIVKHILTQEDFEVIMAENGSKGIEFIKDHYPDLIICDILMPEVDGYGVIKKLFEESMSKVIPFIFMTSKSSNKDIRRGMELGADDYLIKPFTREELLNSINTRLKKQKIIEKQSSEQLNQLRDSILLSLPHEFNSPLTGIIGLSKLIIDNIDALDKSKILDSIKVINNCGKRLYRLAKNYLLYIKLELAFKNQSFIEETKKQMLKTSVKMTVEEESRIIAGRYQRNNDLFVDLEKAYLNISELYLRKIIEEIVDNSFKFSQKGTPVNIFGKVLPQNVYDLHIIDEGKGLSKNEIKQISAYMQFERRSQEQQGSGLGLAIARRLIEFHDGQIHIDSIYKKHTDINITFPLLNG